MEKALVLALSAFGACLGIGLAALGAAIGDGHAASKMLEGTARQPEMGGKLLVNMLISIGFDRIHADYRSCHRYRIGLRQSVRQPALIRGF